MHNVTKTPGCVNAQVILNLQKNAPNEVHQNTNQNGLLYALFICDLNCIAQILKALVQIIDIQYRGKSLLELWVTNFLPD